MAVRVKNELFVSDSLTVFDFLRLNSWAALHSKRESFRGSSLFPWKLDPVKFNSSNLATSRVKWDTHLLFRCCRALSHPEEWDNQKVHLAFDECNYVSASNASRSVWSSSYDTLCLRLYTVKLWIFLADRMNRTHKEFVCANGWHTLIVQVIIVSVTSEQHQVRKDPISFVHRHLKYIRAEGSGAEANRQTWKLL